MYSNDDDDLENAPQEEHGSDELLASDDLRLPEGASILVRLHALRAWLKRRQAEAELEVGLAVLDLQEAMRRTESETRPRRRSEPDTQPDRLLASTQQRLSAYNEADALLESCVAHITVGDRLLVEYYLSLEELIEASGGEVDAPWRTAMLDVLSRIEQVGAPAEDE